jgi:hypothetical protein
MALLATRRESCCRVVRVSRVFEVLRVAGIALRREPLELPGGSAFMARLAVDGRVCADQRKAILVVTNRRDRHFPAFYRMT